MTGVIAGVAAYALTQVACVVTVHWFMNRSALRACPDPLLRGVVRGVHAAFPWHRRPWVALSYHKSSFALFLDGRDDSLGNVCVHDGAVVMRRWGLGPPTWERRFPLNDPGVFRQVAARLQRREND